MEIIKAIIDLIFLPFKLIWNFLKFLFNVQKFIFSLISLIVLLVVLVLGIIYYKPKFIWEPIKYFLNDEYNNEFVYAADNSNFIYEKINKNVELNLPVELTDNEASILICEELSTDKCTSNLKLDAPQLLMNIDEVDSPLWIALDITKNTDNSISLARSGFGRFHFPIEFANKTFDQVLNINSKLGLANKGYNYLLASLINFDKLSPGIDLLRVDIIENKMILIFGKEGYLNNSGF